MRIIRDDLEGAEIRALLSAHMAAPNADPFSRFMTLEL